MNLLVCGGRDFNDKRTVWDVLDAIHAGASTLIEGGPIYTIVTGAAPGADSLAIRWAWSREVDFRGYPARWGVYGKLAGRDRNRRMLRATKELPLDAVLAFPGGRGTLHMMEIAAEQGIRVVRP